MSPTYSPKDMDAALLGICHWMGYRHQLYPHHQLTEGALVGELAGLLSAHLHTDLKVVLEQPYDTLVRTTSNAHPGRPKAVDIVIGPRCSISRINNRQVVAPTVAIEVKRSKVNKGWQEDLKKLSTVWSSNAGWKAWVLLLDQAVAKDDAARRGWIGRAGHASRKRHRLPGGPSFFIRRVTHTQSAHARRVHRAVLLELV